MNAIQAIAQNLDLSDMICGGYLTGLTDADLMIRPSVGINHINWQLGHLIVSDHEMLAAIRPQALPPLPAGLEEQYSKAAASCDDPAKFQTKDELLAIFTEIRKGVRAALEQETEANLDAESGISYAPTVGQIYLMLGSHWLMHCGQWVAVRRQRGLPPLF